MNSASSTDHTSATAFRGQQSGFGLLELMLATMIAAGITLGYLYNQSRQSAIHQAQSQAGYYQMVSDAVAKYMANNYDQLKAITQPKTCSEPPLFTDATAAPAPTGCGIQALFLSGSASSPVANGLQPTLTDLKTTGYLDANFSNSFLWPTQLTMYAASGVKTGSSHAAPEYRVQIQAWCNGAAPSTDTVCDKPVLHSLVYNAQPFAANTTNSFINFSRLDRLMQARTALGANAFISYDWALQKDKLIYSDGNKNQLPNLLKFTSGSDSGIGVEGVLALQNTYTPEKYAATPTPTPTSTELPGKVAYSQCDPRVDTYAYANQESSRVTPLGVVDQTRADRRCKSARTSTDIQNTTARFFAYIVPVGQALACKPNQKAVNYLDSNHDCPIPDSWKTCVTAFGLIPTENTDPNFNYITISVAYGQLNPDYCWQPSPDIYRTQITNQSGGSFNPFKPTKVTNFLCIDCDPDVINATWATWGRETNCIPPKCQKHPIHQVYGYQTLRP